MIFLKKEFSFKNIILVALWRIERNKRLTLSPVRRLVHSLRNDNGLNEDDRRGDEEKWVNLRCILVLDCTGFGDGLGVARRHLVFNRSVYGILISL